MNKLSHIDSLRGIAIIMVVVVHTAQSVANLPSFLKPFTGYCQMGVQLFFVLSAFTLCLSMKMRTEERSTVKFYIRRFFRIAPLYYLGILIYLLVSTFSNYSSSGLLAPASQYTVKNILSNVFFVHGFYPPAFNNIVPGGWSIGTEMAFYLVFPFFFLLYERISQHKKVVLILPLLIVLISFLFLHISLCFFDFGQNGYFYYFNLVNQLSVFSIGMTLFFYTGELKFSKISSVAFLLLFCLFTFILAYNEIGDFALRPFVTALTFVFLFIGFKNLPSLSGALLVKIG